MTVGESGPASEVELRARLTELLRRAHENGVDVQGGWDCRNGPDHPDWDVTVTELRTNGDSG